MKLAHNSKMRFCIAIGAASGIGHALFRGLTANLGPVVGLLVGTVAVAAVVVGIFLMLEHTARRSASR